VGNNSERLNELAMSFKKSQALAAALECDLFSAFAAGTASAADLAKHCGIDAEVADRLIIICRSMRLLDEVDGRITNLDDGEMRPSDVQLHALPMYHCA